MRNKAVIRHALILAVVFFCFPATVAAQKRVSLELVLAIDTSMSIDAFEYDLLVQGMASAFRNPDVIALIGQQDGVAVSLFQWSSSVDRQRTIPWRLLTDEASVLAFAEHIAQLPRSPKVLFTGIGEALTFGVRSLLTNEFDGRRQKIDISGDGRSNIGTQPAAAHRLAEPAGIVVNGLPILSNTDGEAADLDVYYRDHVIHGPGAFIEVARNYRDFARAFEKKLRRELTVELSESK